MVRYPLKQLLSQSAHLVALDTLSIEVMQEVPQGLLLLLPLHLAQLLVVQLLLLVALLLAALLHQLGQRRVLQALLPRPAELFGEL